MIINGELQEKKREISCDILDGIILTFGLLLYHRSGCVRAGDEECSKREKEKHRVLCSYRILLYLTS